MGRRKWSGIWSILIPVAWVFKSGQGNPNYEALWSKVLHILHSVIKEVPYPEAYYAVWEKLRSTVTHNHHDKLMTKLAPGVIFDTTKKNADKDCYPIERDGVTLDSHELRIIFDREKTGFEEER